MSLQRYRADSAKPQSDGATRHYANWLAGPTLAKLTAARVSGLHGEPRVTAYVTGDPDTWFSQPCKFRYLGRVLNGYLTNDDDGNLVVHHCYY